MEKDQRSQQRLKLWIYNITDERPSSLKPVTKLIVWSQKYKHMILKYKHMNESKNVNKWSKNVNKWTKNINIIVQKVDSISTTGYISKSSLL